MAGALDAAAFRDHLAALIGQTRAVRSSTRARAGVNLGYLEAGNGDQLLALWVALGIRVTKRFRVYSRKPYTVSK